MFLVQRVPPRNLPRNLSRSLLAPLQTLATMPPKKRSVHAKSRDHGSNDDEPKTTKRTKTSSSTAAVPSEEKLIDDEGNPFWELGGQLRRVTVSEFKGQNLVSIREHYEKDGKILPGKKGISLTTRQFNTLLSVLPQLDEYLADQGVELTRPVYGGLAAAKEKKKKVEEEKPESNDEEEDEEEEEEEEKEKVKPKKKPVKAASKKAEPRKRRVKSPERVDMSDDE